MRSRPADADRPVGAPTPPVLAAALGGAAAAAAAALGMAALRWGLAVRTVPERVLEWLLLYVPPDLFEAALRRFGFEAKRYGLYAALGGMLLLLAALGAFALRRRWSTRALLVLGLGLWLFTMVVVMPLTDAGLFAVDLLDGTRAAVGGYLAVALTYAATLAIAGATGMQDHAPAGLVRPVDAPSRRSALVLAGGALASFAGTFLAVCLAPRRGAPTRVVVLDPQEPVPSGGIDPPNPHPHVVTTPPAAPPVPASPAAGTPGPATLPAPAPPEQTPVAGLPEAVIPSVSPSDAREPPSGRELARDKDGAVLPSGRRPGELAALITPADAFYVVTKNPVGDPVLRAADWRLRIDGDVQRVVELDYASLRNLPVVEVTKTLECISNFVDKCELAPFGCDLISTARWRGVALADVLGLAGGPRPDVVSLSTVSADEFTTALPIGVALDPETLLVYEMDGRGLSREHGYPARILVPGRYGMKSAKWVVGLRPLRREFIDWYGQRDWSKQGVVQTMTRIDVPARDATLPPGEQRVAGIAYAGDRGVAKVELSANGGATWGATELLEPAPGRDAWARWQGHFTLAPGAEVTLVARATDGIGALQPEEFRLPQPDGSTGWHHLTVRAMLA